MADGLPVSDGAPAVQPTPMVPSQAPAPKETPAKTVALLALQAFNEELQNIGGIPKSEMALWQSHAEKGASQIEEEHLEKISTYLPQAHAQGKKDPFIFFEEIKEQHRANFFTPSGEVISDILRIVKGDLNKLSLHLKQTFEEVKNTITSLDLHEAPLSFENLQILLKNCPNLRSINLDGCGLDEKSLLLLLSRPELSFSIKGYQRISDHAQQHLEALLQYKQQVSDYAFCEASRMRFSVVDELLEFKGLFLPEVECIKEFDTKLKKKTDEILSRIMADATQSVPTVAGLLGLIQKQETQALLLRELGSFFWTQSFSLVYDLQKERLKIICLNNGCPQARVDRLETIVTHLYQKKLEDVLEKAKTVHGEPSILLQQEAEKIKHQNKALVSFFAALEEVYTYAPPALTADKRYVPLKPVTQAQKPAGLDLDMARKYGKEKPTTQSQFRLYEDFYLAGGVCLGACFDYATKKLHGAPFETTTIQPTARARFVQAAGAAYKAKAQPEDKDYTLSAFGISDKVLKGLGVTYTSIEMVKGVPIDQVVENFNWLQGVADPSGRKIAHIILSFKTEYNVPHAVYFSFQPPYEIQDPSVPGFAGFRTEDPEEFQLFLAFYFTACPAGPLTVQECARVEKRT